MIGRILYELSVRGYGLLIRLVAPFKAKAKLWLDGRKDTFTALDSIFKNNTRKVIWFHCSSLGEFELSRPLIEKIKTNQPEKFILLTFFSPSGYEVRKNYEFADYVCYLPLDTNHNATEFIKITKPSVALFAKYEFWYHYLKALQNKNTPAICFSTGFRPSQLFFKWYGGFYHQLLTMFEHIFVLDEASLQLLKKSGLQNCSISGDTRFDRVAEICAKPIDIPIAKAFSEQSQVFVCGSVWPEDLAVILPFIEKAPNDFKFIIAPHEIHENEIEELQKSISSSTIRFSKANNTLAKNAKVLIIDNVGMLSSLYQYGQYAFIGGAFKQGLHNILEAATFSLPIFCGPKIRKFPEAISLQEKGGLFTVENTSTFELQIIDLYKENQKREFASQSCKAFVAENIGASQKILTHCQKFL
jgi:3-deoxy-D-manno-octulosonic-acid transferase